MIVNAEEVLKVRAGGGWGVWELQRRVGAACATTTRREDADAHIVT